MNAPGTLPRWPKGPFPERYRFGAVEARLDAAWTPEREAALEALTEGLEPRPPSDPWLRLFAAPDEDGWRAWRDRAAEAGLFAFRWVAPARERRTSSPAETVGVVATADAVDAVSATGVAGPIHGIGMPAIVRFLVTLRSFGRYEITAMGEDHLELSFEPRNDEALARVCERVLRICPPLARTTTAEALVEAVRSGAVLGMDWS